MNNNKSINEIQEIDITEFEDQSHQIKYEIVMKPVVNFSSIEMKCTVSTQDLQYALRDFKMVLAELQDACSNDVPTKKSFEGTKPQPSKVKLATDKQKEIMKRFQIKFTDSTTQEEANKLINKSIKEANED